jgi:hypothetical protein
LPFIGVCVIHSSDHQKCLLPRQIHSKKDFTTIHHLAHLLNFAHQSAFSLIVILILAICGAQRLIYKWMIDTFRP